MNPDELAICRWEDDGGAVPASTNLEAVDEVDSLVTQDQILESEPVA